MNTLLLTLSILFATIPNLTIRPFPLGTPASYTASAIAADPASPDRVWFTDQVFQQIGWIDVVTGEVKTFSIRPAGPDGVLPAGSPQGLVFGADGNLWFPAIMNASGVGPSAIGRFDVAAGTVTYFPIPTTGTCTFGCRITLGPDGNVWFTEPTDAKLGRVTPQGTITEIPIVTTGGGSTQTMKGIALGSDGNFWIPHGLRNISRVTTSGAATLFRTPTLGTPWGITRGTDGNIYFTQSALGADGNRIGRITPTGVITEWPIPTPNANSTAIAAGVDGKIYFVGQGSKKLGQLDPATGEIHESDIPNGRIPIGIIALQRRAASAGVAVDAEASVRLAFNTLDPSLRDADVEVAEIDEEDEPEPACPTSLSPDALSDGHEDERYVELVRISGGAVTCPCAWSASGLPPGLTLSPQPAGNSAYIEGRPLTAGTYDVNVEWSDSGNCSLKKTVRINVLPFRLTDAAVLKMLPLGSTKTTFDLNEVVDFWVTVTTANQKFDFAWELTDVLPRNLELVGHATNAFAQCESGAQRVVCTGNGVVTVIVRARVLAEGPITNCAEVRATGDVNPLNDRGCFTVNGTPKTRAVRK